MSNIETPAAPFIKLTPEALTELVAVAIETDRSEPAGFAVDDSGQIVFTAEGRTITLGGSDDLVATTQLTAEELAEELNGDPALLFTLADAADIVPFGKVDFEFQAGFMASHGVAVGKSWHLGGLGDTELRSKIGFASDEGNGTLLTHLDSLHLPSSFFAASLELKTFANLFGRVTAGVGADLAHLPPLPDEDYANGIDPTVFPVLENNPTSLPEPTAVEDMFTATEDMPFTGDFSKNDLLPNGPGIYKLFGDPPVGGDLVIEEDGTFSFTPDPNFSGPVTFEVQLTDPATGTVRIQTATIEVTPVADATTPTADDVTTEEDQPVDLTGLTAGLTDTDGSETLSVAITGVPAGATLNVGTEISPGVWSIPLDQLDQVQLTPPENWHGIINLELQATATESGNGATQVTTTPFTVTVDAQADAPTLVGGATRIKEDDPIAIGDTITYGLVDGDGSESVSAVQITGMPAGSSVNGTFANLQPVPGGFIITGTPVEIRATLDALTVQPPLDSDVDFTLTVAVTTTDADGSTATTTAQHPVTIDAVADGPSVVAGPVAGTEDTPIALTGLGGQLEDSDGSAVHTFTIKGVPAGATLSAGIKQPNGDWLLTPTELASVKLNPPSDFHGPIDLTLVSTATETSNGDTASVSKDFTVTVAADADTPDVTVPPNPVAASEDTAVAIGSFLGGALNDTDTAGSPEVLSYRVEDLPVGAIYDIGNGPVTVTATTTTVALTAAQLAAMTVQAPKDFSGDITLNLVAVATEGSNGDTAEKSAPFTIEVAGIADAPTVTPGASSVTEDQQVNVGQNIVLATTDTDNSESISQVVIKGVPDGAAVDFGSIPNVTVTPTTVTVGGVTTTTYTITSNAPAAGGLTADQAAAAQIEKALDAFVLTPPEDDGRDIELQIVATAKEPNGSTQDSAEVTHTIAVTPDADAPTVTGQVVTNGTEDTNVPITAMTAALNDKDPSEQLTLKITGVEAGNTFNNGAVDPNDPTVWIISEADLATLEFIPKPDTSGQFDMKIVATATEFENGVAGDTETTEADLKITINAVADTPTITPGSSATNEDTQVAVGQNFTLATTDTDGSESISQVVIKGVPNGATTDFGSIPNVNIASVVASDGTTTYTITSNAPAAGGLTADQAAAAQIEAALDAFKLTPPLNVGDDIDLKITVTAKEPNGATANSAEVTHTIDVTPIADAPVLTGQTVTNGQEDTNVALPDLNAPFQDNDGSETHVLKITGVEAGNTFNKGNVDPTDPTVWLISKADLAGLEFIPKPDASGQFDMKLVATATELEGSTATTEADIKITINAVADTPTITPGSSTVDEDMQVEVGKNFSLATTDTDGSESISQVVIKGVPDGAAVDFGSVPNVNVASATVTSGGVTTTTYTITSNAPAAGGLTADQAAAAQIELAMDAFKLTPPLHVGDDIDLKVTVTAKEPNGSTQVSAEATHTIDVAPVVDAPEVTGGEYTGTEDTALELSNTISTVAANLVDQDGSESLTSVIITGLPANSSFTTGVSDGGTGWIFSPADFVAGQKVTFNPPANVSGIFNMAITAISKESAGAPTESVTKPIKVTINPDADAATVTTGTTTVTEEDDIAFGADISITGNDLDGSETMKVELSNLPASGAYTFTADPDVTVTPVTVGNVTTYTVDGPPAKVKALVATFKVDLVDHDAADFAIGVKVTITDTATGLPTDTEVVTATHNVVITPVADAPTVSAKSTAADEDVATKFGQDIEYALVDGDGSEKITAVEVSGVPTGAMLTYTPLAGVTVTGSATTGWTINSANPADIRTVVNSLTYTPAADDDDNVDLVVKVTTTDEGTVSATTTGSHTLAVAAVADDPTISGSGSGSEDTTFAVPVTVGTGDTDGSETVTEVVVTAPAGVTVSNFGTDVDVAEVGQVWTITAKAGSTTPEADIKAALLAMQVTPADDRHEDFQLDVKVTATETNPTDDGAGTSEVAMLTTSKDFKIDVAVTAVADKPTVDATSTAMNEDVTTTFGQNITYSLNDTDGSEKVTAVELTGIPSGAAVDHTALAGVTVTSFTGGIRVEGANPADIRTVVNSLTYDPTEDSDANVDLTVKVTVDDDGVSTAFETGTHTLLIAAVADAPTLVNAGPGGADAKGDEDKDIAVPLTVADGDADASEEITKVVITAPADVELGGLGTDVTVVRTGQVWTLTGSDADLKAAMLNLTAKPPLNDGDDFQLTVDVTTTETNPTNDGPGTEEVALLNQTKRFTVDVEVDPIADQPTVASANYTTAEDTPVDVPALSGSLGDNDGSEVLSFRITGVDPDASFSRGSRDPNDPTVWLLTANDVNGTGLPPIQYTPKPQADGVFKMVLESIATEVEGGVALNSTKNTANLDITVTPVLDAPELDAATTTGNEDTQLTVGSDIDLTIDDLDGSQTLTIELDNIPTDATVTVTGATAVVYNNGVVTGASYTRDPGTGKVTLTGNPDAVSDLLDTLTVKTKLHEDDNFTVQVTATSYENGTPGTTLSDTTSHTVQVAAVADKANFTIATPATGDEDTDIAISLNLSLKDADGSESIEKVVISNVPGDAVLKTTNANVSLNKLPDGTWELTGSDADITAALSTGFAVRPGENKGDDIALTFTATTIESTPSETGTGEIAKLRETTPLVVNVDVVPVTDTIGATGNEWTGQEDTWINLTAGGGNPALGYSQVDSDGSETMTFTLSGVPDGARFREVGSGSNINTSTLESDGTRTFTFTKAQVDAGLRFRPPTHLHDDSGFDMVWTVTTSEQTSAVVESDTANIKIIVTARADRPNIGIDAEGDEDQVIEFGKDVDVRLVDRDGSEELTSITVDLPGGETPNYTTSIGTASVAVVGGKYVITATGGTATSRQADMQSILDTFTVTPPLHSDADIPLTITATTVDADGSTASRTTSEDIVVRAVADAPAVTTAGNITTDEDVAIALDLAVAASADTDGSETLSVRLFDLPAGSIVTGSTAGGVAYTQQGDDWIVTGPSAAAINASLATATYKPPLNFAGTITAGIEAISTEGATGSQVATKDAKVTDTFTITVAPIADSPELRVVDATEGAAGLEDTLIRLNIDVRPADKDSSEQITKVTITGVPSGATLTDASGTPVGSNFVTAPDGTTSVDLTLAQLATLHIDPIEDSNVSFSLGIEAEVTDTSPGQPSSTQTISGSIDVDITGVADAANISALVINATEDQPYALGAQLTNVLSDDDGSETVFFVITGLPAGVVPSAGVFVGNNSWQVSAADMPGVTIPAANQFSGDYTDTFASNLKIRAITQENDGDETSVTVDVTINVAPVVDGKAVTPTVTVTEDNDISLASAAITDLPDADGSEKVELYTFDFTNIIADAGIATATDANDFIAQFLKGGTFTNTNGIVEVDPAQLAGLYLDKAAFPDSNRDFSIPLDVRFSDTDDGGVTKIFKTISGSYSVNLVGDADTPTVFVDDYRDNTNIADTIIALNPNGTELGGAKTDIDNSESIYYVVSGLGQTGEPQLTFVNPTGQPVGLNNQDGTWLFTAADLVGLSVTSPSGSSGLANLKLTTVVTENDNAQERAIAEKDFKIEIFTDGGTPNQTPIQPPSVVVQPMTVNEDGTQTLDAQITPQPAGASHSIAVVLTGIPADATVSGAFFNPATNGWVTTADAVNAGQITITPAPDFSGTLDVKITATSTDAGQNSATNSNVPAPITVTPVADGPAITLSSPGGNEDQAGDIPLTLSIALQDTNGAQPEVLQDTVTIRVTEDATVIGAVQQPNGDWHVDKADLANVKIRPEANNSNEIEVTVFAATQETANGATAASSETITIAIAPVADAPTVTTTNATGNEDTAINLSPNAGDLSVELVDTDGSEVLSVVLSGVPAGSILSSGANNGDGTWTLDPNDLDNLMITPPTNFSGTVTMNLIGYTLETSTGATATSTKPIVLTVEPQADGVVFQPLPQTGAAGDPIALDLNVLMGDKTGTGTGENPAETLTVVLTGPAGFTVGSTGGTIVKTGATEWTFTGTEAQANTLNVTSYGAETDIEIGISMTTMDGTSVGTPVTGTVPITVTSPGTTRTGNATDETLTGGAGIDLIAGGGGSDILTGGAGADLFIWGSGDLAGGGVDTITDFDTAKDVLDISALIPNYDPGQHAISDFISLSVPGGGSDPVLKIDADGTGNASTPTDVVELTGGAGLDLNTLISTGALIV